MRSFDERGRHLTGELSILGLDPRREGSRIKTRIGVQLQTASLYPYLTVCELIDLFGRFYPRHVPLEPLPAALALRQVIIGGSPFVPLAACLAVLAGWLVVCMAISARFFRWQ